jgi:hypothetical protein
MAWLLNGSGDTLREFLIDHVEQGATVITDGWAPYRPATKDLYAHERVVQPGTKASELLPGVHRIASLVQRWLFGTHQAAVNESHLSLYLDEFVFRFNRRHSRSRGMVLLPRARARRRARPGPLQRTDPQPAAQHHPPDPARDARTTREPRPSAGEPAPARRAHAPAPLRWIARFALIEQIRSSVRRLVGSVRGAELRRRRRGVAGYGQSGTSGSTFGVPFSGPLLLPLS